MANLCTGLCMFGATCTRLRADLCVTQDSRLGLIGLLLHDVHDHATGGGAALWCRVDSDGFFRCTCIFLPVNVDPERLDLNIVAYCNKKDAAQKENHLRQRKAYSLLERNLSCSIFQHILHEWAMHSK